MIEDGVLVDTSVLIEFFKGSKDISEAVSELLQENRVATTGIVIAELLQGMKNTKEELSFVGLLEGTHTVEVTNDIWIKAGKTALALRKNGITLPLTDIAIASLAITHDLSVFTLDKHFGQIPEVELYRF
jgi:predicted nucleic acid-binding protein